MASEEGQVINCHTVVVHFTRGHLGTYQQVGSLLDPIAKKKPDVIYVKIIVDELKSVAEEWEVEALPVDVFIKEGKIVDKIVGGDRLEVWSAVLKHSSPATQDCWWGALLSVVGSPATVTPTG